MIFSRLLSIFSASPPHARLFSRAQIALLPWQSVHRARNFTKANVSRLEFPAESGRFVILKDIAHQPLWLRVCYSRPILAREWRALRALAGLDVAPYPVERVDADAFVMSEVRGATIHKHHHTPETRCALENAGLALQSLHERGVTHGDLHRANLLIDETGRARFVDFATACVFRSRRGVKAWSWAQWQNLDRRALAKLKAHHARETLSPDELAILSHQSRISLFVRKSGKLLRALLKRGRKPDSPR